MGNSPEQPLNAPNPQLSNSMIARVVKQVKKERRLKHDWTCPNCMKVYPVNSELSQFQQHIKVCITYAEQVKQQSRVRSSSNIDLRKSGNFSYKKINDVENKWQKKQKTIDQVMIDVSQFTLHTIKAKEFDTKNKWFQKELQKRRIGWDKGFDRVVIDKKNLLRSSMAQFEKINLRKEVKVVFEGEKSNDAGGLLRQFVHLVVKQILSPQAKVFKRADTKELSYKINRCKQSQLKQCKQILKFYGRIIGKCLMEKIPIGTFMDRTITRQLCGKQIQLQDIFTYDQSMYRSWKSMLESSINDCQFTFTLLELNEKGDSYDHQLVTNGRNVLVTDENKQQFISKAIKYTCFEKVKGLIDSLKEGLFSVIPAQLLTIFPPNELEMLLYGVPFIDIEDWQSNTEYMGAYYKDHKNIQWFWKIVRQQPQQKLSRLLHFCTGSTRVPINGFSKLQTNRGESSKFVIQSAEYNKSSPYPKGHTCFNRLQLPVYPSKDLLLQYVSFVLDNDLEGVLGLD